MKVIVVEAASYAGGRMHTLKEDGFSEPVEAGAEFIHGKQPITLGLLQEAGIEFTSHFRRNENSPVWSMAKG
jgi:monoamine oxidase